MPETSPQDFDVMIVGAGVNGAGLFRDLCAQGVTCAIVEKGDFGSGTSAAPSRLIHGGLKYLETGEFGLVRQSTYERNLLLRNAPHFVKPLQTVIPIRSWMLGIGPALRTLLGSTTAPRSRGAVLVKIGLALYDLFGARARVMPRHAMWSRRRALAEMPALMPGIKAVGTYHDAAITAPERLVLELVQDGLRDSSDSLALNWAVVEGQVEGIVQITGPDGRRYAIRPRVVVNAAGPWIDRVNAIFGEDTAQIGGTKGSHILLDHPELVAQLNGRMIYFEGDDGRILLVFPFLGRALVGSTDIPAEDPDRVACDADETAYFIDSLRRLLPGLEFDARQIVFSYAGLRPLPNSEGVEPGLISRDHSSPELAPTKDRPFPIVSLVGGKWTTFRGFAEEVADSLLGRLGLARKVSTAGLPIGGGRDMPTEDADRKAWISGVTDDTGSPADRVEILLGRYGTTARAIAAAEGAVPTILPGDAGVSAAEIAWIAANERVVRLEDLVLRRTTLAITGQATPELCEAIRDTVAPVLTWSADRARAELAQLFATLETRHRVTFDSEP